MPPPRFIYSIKFLNGPAIPNTDREQKEEKTILLSIIIIFHFTSPPARFDIWFDFIEAHTAHTGNCIYPIENGVKHAGLNRKKN